MSTDFDLRLRSAFTAGELRDETERVMAEIVPGAAVAVDVVPSTRDFVHHGMGAQRASASFLGKRYGESGLLGPEFVLMTNDAVAGVAISPTDVGYSDDPEGGRTLSICISLDRTPASILLGAATAVAAARLTGSPIRDESAVLTGNRIVDPAEVVNRLRAPANDVRAFPSIAVIVLRGLNWYGERWDAWLDQDRNQRES